MKGKNRYQYNDGVQKSAVITTCWQYGSLRRYGHLESSTLRKCLRSLIQTVLPCMANRRCRSLVWSFWWRHQQCSYSVCRRLCASPCDDEHSRQRKGSTMVHQNIPSPFSAPFFPPPFLHTTHFPMAFLHFLLWNTTTGIVNRCLVQQRSIIKCQPPSPLAARQVNMSLISLGGHPSSTTYRTFLRRSNTIIGQHIKHRRPCPHKDKDDLWSSTNWYTWHRRRIRIDRYQGPPPFFVDSCTRYSVIHRSLAPVDTWSFR